MNRIAGMSLSVHCWNVWDGMFIIRRVPPPQYKEVVVEKFSSESERPDYTLTLNGVSKIFVEAKKPSVNIRTDKAPALQARKYGWNAKHKISVLTNFEDLMIFDTTNQPTEGDVVSTSLYRCYHYQEYIERYAEIYSLLSRESVYSGEFDRFLAGSFQDTNRYTTEIDDVFLKQMKQWRLEIGRYLYNASAEFHDIDLLNDRVQEFINQIVFLRICEDRNLPVYRKLKDTAENKAELQAPYMFNIIEPGILGKIYESFLAEALVLDHNRIELAAKKEYKYRSVVSTPVEIVKYMVKTTLEPYCAGKTPAEILGIRLADISCGSGIF